MKGGGGEREGGGDSNHLPVWGVCQDSIYWTAQPFVTRHVSGFCCTHLNFSAFAHIDCECICLVHALWPVLTECIYLVHSLWPVLTECIYLVHSLWPVLSVSTWSIHCDLYWLWMYLPGPFILTSADCEWICLVHSLWPVLTVNVSTWSIHTDLYWLCSVSQVYQPGPFAMTCTGYEFIYRVHSLWPVLTEFIYLVHPLWPVLSASTWSIHFDLYWLWVYLPGPFTLTCTDCECIYLVRFDLYWLWVYLPGSLWPGLTVSVSTWFTLTWTDCECIYLVHFDLDWLWVYLPGSLWPGLTVSVSTWFALTCTDCECIYLVQFDLYWLCVYLPGPDIPVGSSCPWPQHPAVWHERFCSIEKGESDRSHAGFCSIRPTQHQGKAVFNRGQCTSVVPAAWKWCAAGWRPSKVPYLPCQSSQSTIFLASHRSDTTEEGEWSFWNGT